MNKLIISLFCLTFLFSCDKDNDTDNSNNIPTNYVLYDGVYYDIGGPCLIEDFGEFDDGLYNLDITIVSPNMYIDEDGDIERSLSIFQIKNQKINEIKKAELNFN